MNERSCVVCRKRRPSSELLPIHRQGDRLALGPAPSGRGSWVHPACVARVSATRFGRGHPGPDPETVRAMLVGLVEHAFTRARAAGAIASGRVAVARCADATVVLVARDAGNVARRTLPAGVPVVRLPWSSAEVGRLLARGPRSVLALRRSERTNDLLARLRLLESVG